MKRTITRVLGCAALAVLSYVGPAILRPVNALADDDGIKLLCDCKDGSQCPSGTTCDTNSGCVQQADKGGKCYTNLAE
jgi:hypothetical protein